MSDTSASIGVFDLFQQGWDILKQTWKKMALAVIVFIAFQVLVQLSDEAVQKSQSATLSLLVGLASLVLGIVLQSGMIAFSLRLIREKTAEVSDLFAQKGVWLNFFIAMLAYEFLVVLGMLLLIVPGIYWAAKYSFVQYLVVDKKMSLSDAFRKSGTMTQGKIMKILGFWFLAILVNFGGLIALGVGLLVTLPTTQLASALLYEKLLGEGPAVVPAVTPEPAQPVQTEVPPLSEPPVAPPTA